MQSKLELLKEAITLKQSEIEMTENSTTLNRMQKVSKLSKLKDQLGNLMEKLTKLENPKSAEKTDDEVADAAQEQVEYYLRFLEKHDYRYVQKGHVYVKYMPDGSYVPVKPMSLREAHPELSSAEDITVFKMALEQDGRIYTEATKSFRPQPPWVLNLLTRDNWIKPVPGPHHEIFDILLLSKGGGKLENTEHIEKVFAWKYKYPEEFLLPTIVIFGQGEVGKNLFIEKVATTIFGEDQVQVLEADHVLGNFNGLAAGKTILMLNECVSDHISMEAFKARVNSNRCVVNEKYGLQYICDATALPFTGGNGIVAGVKLAGDKSDRRWSIIRVTKSLMEHIQEIKGLNAEDAFAWFESVKSNLWDKEQCAHWLYNLLEKWKGETCRPRFLDGEDRKWLLNVQRKAWQGLIDRVFGEPSFSHINTTLLYLMYKWYSKEFQPAIGKLMSDQGFYATVDRHCEQHYPEITRRTLHVVKGDKETSKPYYAHASCAWKVTDNDHKYNRPTDRGDAVYLVPEMT